MFENKERWWDPISAASISFLALFSASSLASTNWTPELNHILPITTAALLLGFLIGISKFKMPLVYILMGLYSFAILFLLGVIPLSSDPLWNNRILNYSERMVNSIGLLINNIPLDNGVIFWTVMALIFWSTSLVAAFHLARKGQSKFTALIFAIIFFSIQYYMPDSKQNYFLIFLFSMILIFYFNRLFYIQKAHQWKERRIREDREVVWSMSRSVFFTSIIILTFSWSIVFVVDRASERRSENSDDYFQAPLNSWDFFNNLFNPLKQSPEFGIGEFSENLYIGESRSLNEDMEFIISVPLDEDFSSNYYWRGRTYSFYANGYWTNKKYQVSHYSDLEFTPFPSPDNKLFTYQIEYFRKNKQIFVPSFGIPEGIDAKVSFLSIENNKQDILSWEGVRKFKIGQKVEIRGYSREYSEDELYLDTANYPKWINGNYLNIPETMEERLHDLASSLVHEEGTTFEKVILINDYLRNNFIYRDAVEIPENMDPVEYFLFNGKEGFCNYFATAEVLLLRSLGIPSRLVVGYSEGEKINNQQYKVRIKDSHAWVEVFFPDAGWVVFEPTPTHSALKYEKNILAKKESEILDMDGTPPVQTDRDAGIPEDVLTNKDFVDSAEVLKEKKYLALIIALFILPILIYIYVFHENRILFVPVIEKAIELTGIKNPVWLDKWSAYESLPAIAKKMKRIRQVSTLLIDNEEKLTSLELFIKLNQIIIGKSDQFEYFLNVYQQAVFGGKEIHNDVELRQVYIGIVGSVLASAIKRFISKWMSQINTG